MPKTPRLQLPSQRLPSQRGVKPKVMRVTVPPPEHPWERRADETQAAFDAFTVYRGLPPTERTIRHTQDLLRKKSETTIRDWCKRHAWVSRCIAYDRYQDNLRWGAEEQVIVDRARKWATVREQHREKALELGKALLEKAEAMLRFPLQTVEQTTSQDGKQITTVVHPAKWSMADIPKYLDTADKVIRLAAEMDTERHRVEHRALQEEVRPYAEQLGISVEDFIAKAEAMLAAKRE